MASQTDSQDTSTREAQLADLPDWRIVERDGIERLERMYEFPNFRAALDFTVRVGEMAEEANHHPAVLTEWGKVTVTWWTHSAGGIAPRDFEMAAATDDLA